MNPDTIGVAGIGRSRSVGSLVTCVFVEAINGEIVKLDVEFHVMPNFEPGICIGVDVMHAFDIDVLISEKAARMRKLRLKFPIQFERGTQKSCNIRALRDITIPAMSHKIIPINWNPEVKSIDHFFEPCVSFSSATEAFGMASKSIIRGDATKLVYFNFGKQPIRLKKDERIGKASPLRADEFLKAANESMVLRVNMRAEDPADHVVHETSDANELHLGEIPEFPCFPADEDESDPSVPSQRTDLSLRTDPGRPTIAILPEGQDRQRLPAGPTYKQFDIALNEDGIPHPEIVKVIEDNIEAFALDGNPGRVKDGTEIRIKTDDAKLAPEPMRRVGPEKAQVIRDTIQQLLDWNVIEKSNSRVSYPILLVWQRNKWRFCIDYRKLNEATEADTYPMMRIATVFDALNGMSFFSILDALRGYHNIPVTEIDRWKTAFISAEGLFQFLGMPFGLKNAPAVFQRFIDALLGHLRWKAALAYIDDIIVFAKTLAQHVKDLDYLLKEAIRVGLKFAVDKCHFGYTSLSLLGRIIGTDGLHINQHKAQAVLDMKIPETMKELYTAIGMFGSYRAFIYGFAIIAAPLTSLTTGNKFKNPDGTPNVEWQRKKIQWGPEQDRAYKELKAIIASPPVLAFPDLSLRFYLYMDASKIGYAFALHQRFPKKSTSTFITMNEVELPESLDNAFEWKRSLEQDPVFSHVYGSIDDHKDYRINDKGLLIVVKDGQDKLCVPKSRIADVFHDIHDAIGHPGFARSWDKCSRLFFRPSLYTSLKSYIEHCPICLRIKVSHKSKPGSMPSSDIEPKAFHTVALDFVTGLPIDRKTSHDCILLVVDVWTKTVILIPTFSSYTAASVANDFFNFVVRRGFLPHRFISDNDKVFIGHFWKALTDKLNIKCRFTSPYHAQSDPAER